MVKKANDAVVVLHERRTHAVEVAQTTATSLVAAVGRNPLVHTALAAVVFAENTACNIATLVSDVSETALDKVLSPEVCRPLSSLTHITSK